MASVRTTPSRVFVHSSVFFAAALSPSGGARELFLRGLRGELVLIVSDLVLDETRRNLAAKAPSVLTIFEQFVQLGFLETTRKPTKAQVLRTAKLVEAKDAPIVAAALLARADYLATHDAKHLLAQADLIRDSFAIVVGSPGDILRLHQK